MLTNEEYDELLSKKIKLDEISCSCHIMPPCWKCENSIGEEDLKLMKKYEALKNSKVRTLTLDIETTGLPPKNADYKIDFMKFPRILSIAWKFDDQETKEVIINQGGFEIPPEATAINGITTEMCQSSTSQLEGVLIEEILKSGVPDFVIGHNIYFDTSIIKANILRLIQEGRITQYVYEQFEEFLHKDKRIDTMRKSIKFCGVGAYPKLTVLYKKLFNEEFNAHTAKGDVDATYRCYLKLKEMGNI